MTDGASWKWILGTPGSDDEYYALAGTWYRRTAVRLPLKQAEKGVTIAGRGSHGFQEPASSTEPTGLVGSPMSLPCLGNGPLSPLCAMFDDGTLDVSLRGCSGRRHDEIPSSAVEAYG